MRYSKYTTVLMMPAISPACRGHHLRLKFCVMAHWMLFWESSLSHYYMWHFQIHSADFDYESLECRQNKPLSIVTPPRQKTPGHEHTRVVRIFCQLARWRKHLFRAIAQMLMKKKIWKTTSIFSASRWGLWLRLKLRLFSASARRWNTRYSLLSKCRHYTVSAKSSACRGNVFSFPSKGSLQRNKVTEICQGCRNTKKEEGEVSKEWETSFFRLQGMEMSVAL